MADTEFRLARAGDVALVTIDNDEDWTKPTVLSRGAIASLARVLDELERGGFAAMVLTGKPFVFCVGADIDEFPHVTREAAEEVVSGAAPLAPELGARAVELVQVGARGEDERLAGQDERREVASLQLAECPLE